jgi:hypothetical protein
MGKLQEEELLQVFGNRVVGAQFIEPPGLNESSPYGAKHSIAKSIFVFLNEVKDLDF